MLAHELMSLTALCFSPLCACLAGKAIGLQHIERGRARAVVRLLDACMQGLSHRSFNARGHLRLHLRRACVFVPCPTTPFNDGLTSDAALLHKVTQSISSSQSERAALRTRTADGRAARAAWTGDEVWGSVVRRRSRARRRCVAQNPRIN